jgi:multiple sugar transport system permease protein
VRRPRSALDRGRNGFGYFLLAPQVIAFTAVGVVALGWVIWLSMNHINILARSQTFVGLDNYVRILQDPNMATVLPNTLFFVVIISVSNTVIGLLLALLMNQKLPGITVFRSLIFVPALVTMVAWTLVWRFIVQPQGGLDALLGLVGIPEIPWLRSGWVTLVLFAFIQMTKNVGINMILFLSALQSIPQELSEAARIDGANRWGVFRHVTVPQISASTLMVFMLTVVGSFKIFEIVLLLTNGGPGVQTSVLSFAIYQNAFVLNDVGYASALAVLLFALVLILSGLIWQLRKRLVFNEE